MAGPEIENRSPGPRPVILLYIVAFTLVGVHLSGPGGRALLVDGGRGALAWVQGFDPSGKQSTSIAEAGTCKMPPLLQLCQQHHLEWRLREGTGQP